MARMNTAQRTDALLTLFGYVDPFAGMVGAPALKWSAADLLHALLRALGHTEPCSRCGGGGHYSFNLRDGTTCFKCRGKGTTVKALNQTVYDAVLAQHAAGEVDAIKARSRTLRGLTFWSNEDQKHYSTTDTEWVARELAYPTVEVIGEKGSARVRRGTAVTTTADGKPGGTYHGHDHEMALEWARNAVGAKESE